MGLLMYSIVANLEGITRPWNTFQID